MNIYERIGLKRVINACGKMTILGVSAVDRTVMDEVAEAASNYVEIDTLIDRVGELISTHTGAEDSCVTSSASAGIAISVAAVISKGDPNLVERLPDSSGLANEVILLKGHSVNYGAPVTTMVRLGGGVPVEVGQANESEAFHVASAITGRTAAILYVKSHHAVQKGMVPLAEMIRIAHEHGLPLIIDAAAEEDLKKYVAAGADLVIYSGAKAIDAPTSGFITGRKALIGACKAQYHGIGRPMKIGKECMLGLVKALDRYAVHKHDGRADIPALEAAIAEVNGIRGLSAELEQDEAGREIYRARVRVHADVLGVDAAAIEAQLRGGSPAIYTRKYYLNAGVFSIDPRPLQGDDLAVIVARLRQLAGACLQENTAKENA
ncbi:D-glucosaminate-6-phosphate ammonia lyase [Jeongeupia chitinilytica]|uniref:Selenocysteine synthase n=1 Tax=Jeongeupia chitinilytica TaxID=1041641 RepID=A0ABQ3H4R8_9NEIS|nr:DgaE family pyridoxal phosphate-dependent ammonia lyase [Jeongeupia chitinilytica]GHD68446.1 selenocysteine synthase [Jeongeupia chitinilytica]